MIAKVASNKLMKINHHRSSRGRLKKHIVSDCLDMLRDDTDRSTNVKKTPINDPTRAVQYWSTSSHRNIDRDAAPILKINAQMIGDFFTEDALTMTLDIPQIIGYTHYINFFLGVEQHNPTNLSIVLPIKLIYHKKKKTHREPLAIQSAISRILPKRNIRLSKDVRDICQSVDGWFPFVFWMIAINDDIIWGHVRL